MRKVFLFSVFAFLVILSACGRKGDLIIPGTVLPDAVANVAAEPVGGVVNLAWTMPGKNTRGEPLTDLAGFVVMRAEVPDDTGECPCRFEKAAYIDLEFPGGAVVQGKRVGWTQDGSALTYGRKYAFKVAGINRDGYAGVESQQVVVRFLAPPAPPLHLAAGPGNRSVVLKWEANPVDEAGNSIPDLTGYNVYRSKRPGEFPPNPINTVYLPSPEAGAASARGDGYSDTGLENNETYYYRVTTLRGTEPPFTEGEPTGTAQATPADKEAPERPTGLRAVPGEGEVLLSWDPDMEPDLKGYIVYRKGPDDADFRPMTDGPTGFITFEDKAAAPGSTYTYAVTAVDDASPPNESPRSEEATVTAP